MMANQGAVCSRLSVRRQLFVTTVRQRLFLSCLFLMHFYLCSNISIRQPPFVPRQVQAGQLFFLKLEGKQEHSHSFSLSLSLAEPPWSVWDKALFHGPTTVVATASWGRQLNFMAAVTVCSDFGTQRKKICLCFHFFPDICHEGAECHDLSFLNVGMAESQLCPCWPAALSTLLSLSQFLASRGGGTSNSHTEGVLSIKTVMHVDGLAGCHAYSKPLYFYLCYYFSGWRVKSSQFSKNSGKCILI